MSERKLAGRVTTEVQVYQSESNSVHAIGLISREQTKLCNLANPSLATKDGKIQRRQIASRGCANPIGQRPRWN